MRPPSGLLGLLWVWLGCHDGTELNESLRGVQPDWSADVWATVDAESWQDFYNVQRAIHWGNRRLAVRRARASLDRIDRAVAGGAAGSRGDLEPRLDALRGRVDALEQLDDWRLEAEALNHAILELGRDLGTLRT